MDKQNAPPKGTEILPCAWWPQNSLSARCTAHTPQTPTGLWLHAASEADEDDGVEASGVNVLLDKSGIERLHHLLGEWLEANR